MLKVIHVSGISKAIYLNAARQTNLWHFWARNFSFQTTGVGWANWMLPTALFSSLCFLIPACSLVRDFLFWLILTGSRHQVCFGLPTCSDWQELNWLQTSESNWLETTSVGRNFYCFQTALFVHRYYQTNRSNQHKAVFLLQININKYKTKLFQLEQTGHGWHNFLFSARRLKFLASLDLFSADEHWLFGSFQLVPQIFSWVLTCLAFSKAVSLFATFSFISFSSISFSFPESS